MEDFSGDVSVKLNLAVTWAHKKMDDGVEQYETILRTLCDRVEDIALGTPPPARYERPLAADAVIKMEGIAAKVSAAAGIPLARMRGPSRMNMVVDARRVAIYVTRQTTRLPFAEIGRYFGRDHSTVVYNCRTVQRDMKLDLALKYRVELLIHEAA